MAERGTIMQDIESQLYLSKISYPVLERTVIHSGEIRAWYRASRKALDSEGGFREVNWFLTDKALIRQEIKEKEIFFVSFYLESISRVERFYDVNPAATKEAVLRRLVIFFNDGKCCDLLMPSLQFQGDLAGFERLAAMLV